MPRRAVSRGPAPATDAERPAAPVAPRQDPRPSTQKEQTTATIPAKFRGPARRDAAAFYLTQLARGVLSGEVAVGAGERRMTLATAEYLVLEIEVKQKKRATHIGVKMRWPKRPLIRIGSRGGHRNG